LVPEKSGLVNFVEQVMLGRKASEDVIQQAMQDAAEEMYKGGIVAVGDICNTTHSLQLKQSSKLHWHNFIEVSGFVAANAEKRFAEMQQAYEAFSTKKTGNNNQKTTFCPHAPYSVSKQLFELINNASANQLISIHNQECAAEDVLYKNKSGNFLNLYNKLGIDITSFESTGKSSLQSFLPYFTNKQSVILVHNSFTNQDDILFQQLQSLQQQLQTFYCLCVNANQYIEQTSPPINLLRKNNCQIVIGTDSYASNWQLNILEEIKTIQQQTNHSIPLQELLQWATINGARALRMEDKLGSFEKGKQPGVLLIESKNQTISTAKRIL
jgi:cytosine/adenosine deaminase-related metal-dependent hydrolase